MVSLTLMLVLAADPRWGLTFNAPPGCIQAGELAERIEKHAGRPLFGANPDLRIEASVRAGPPAKWSARLTLLDAAGNVLGTRDVTADTASCHGIDESLTLVIGLMIDTRLKEAPPPPKAPEPTAPPPPPQTIERRPPADDFSRLLRRERSGIWLGGYAVDQDAFYAMVGRNDLQAALSSRRTKKGAAFTLGGVLILTGGLLVSLEALGRIGTDSHWPLATGGTALILGIIAFVVGGTIRSHPTTDDEDDGLIEGWNLKQRVSTE